jgi:signal transduction histidine kinase
VDVNELIRETLELAQRPHDTPVTTTTELTQGLPAIEGERVQLQRVFLNLIVNAADR